MTTSAWRPLPAVPARDGTGPGLVVLAPAAGAAGVSAAVVRALADPGPRGVWSELSWTLIGVVPGLVVAVWLVGKRPGHPQARRFLLMASALGVSVGAEGFIRSAYRDGGPGDWFWWANAVDQYVTLLAIVPVVTLLITFPGGVVEHRWQRWLQRVNLSQLALPPLLLLACPTLVVDRFLLDDAPDLPSPFAVPALAWLGGALAIVIGDYLVAMAAMVALLLRHLTARGELRHRTRLFAWAVTASALCTGARSVVDLVGVPVPVDRALNGLTVLAMAAMPASIVVGVLRHRLFDIDAVVRRSVVYGALTLGITAVYVALAAAPGLAFGTRIPLELAVVLTVLAAVAFDPLRRRLDGVADRWVFGDRVNRYELLTDFGSRLEQAVDLRDLLPELAATVRRGLTADWVRVTLPNAAAHDGTPVGDPALSVPLERGGEPIGHIDCGPRDGGYDGADHELLTTRAAQAATAIANVHLTTRLAERLDDLSRSRARIVAAQDEERRRIERDIHDGAQQHVVALITKVRLARNQLGRGERSTGEVLDELAADARDLLSDLRELAHGIHPPVLSDRGLVAAVEARADRFPLDVVVHADPALRGRRLDAETEGAAYFTVCEALTNVVKHAGASAAVVDLRVVHGRLVVEIRDDGTGCPAGAAGGHGLTNLRDRIETLGGGLVVDGRPGEGTRVRTELPV